MTDCAQDSFHFPRFDHRKIEAGFTGGDVRSDGGVLLLRQRIYGLALGYEDLNDHATLRLDPAWQTALERDDKFASPARPAAASTSSNG